MAGFAPCTPFFVSDGTHSVPLAGGALPTKSIITAHPDEPVLIFDDGSARQVEIDFRGSTDDVLARLETGTASRGPGRPRLGVTAREVTLLPRHWDWLAEQPGGASALLRRLVEDAMRHGGAKLRGRQACEAADRFMRTMAGDL